MTLTQIQHFVEIVKHGSINAAAIAFYMSYQAMYKSLKNLERELDLTLVSRNPSGIVLTAEGKLFYQDALKILEMAEQWRSLSQKQHDKARSILKIYTTHFFIFTRTLDNLAAIWRSQDIFADAIPSCVETMNNLMQQNTIADNVLFLTQYHPQKSNIKAFAKAHDCKYEYLCSDFIKIYCNRMRLSPGQTSVSIADLKGYDAGSFFQ